MVSTIRIFTFLVAVVCGLDGALLAQQPDAFFARTEFAQWATQGPVEQIPWQLHVIPGGLTTYQRIVGHYVIDVPGRYFKQRPGSGDVIALVQVADSAGRVYQHHSIVFMDSKNPELKHGGFFAWHAFMLPGEYEATLALYDKSTGKHSFARRSLRIEPLSKDPLPDAWRDLPPIEFLEGPTKPPDSYFHPEAAGRLRLPLVAQRPVRIEVLANLTGTGRAMVSHNAYNFNLGSLLPILKTFSQVDVRGGALNIEVLDLVRRRVAFQQDDARNLDWPRLKAAVTAADPTKVDVQALQDVKHTAAFLRQEVARRIESGAGPPDALPVLVLISSAALFDSLSDIRDTLLPSECQCVVYYVRYDPFALRFHRALVDFDNVNKVLKPLPVRTRVADSPQDLRRIMAEIMDEISKL
jgi:hypothetical protein